MQTSALLITEVEPVPVEMDEDGVARVAGTRVTLDTVVGAFEHGATAEEIVYQYPSLNLADAYAVISYYLHRRSAVDAYLLRRRDQRAQVRAQSQIALDATGMRDRLLARRANQRS